MAHRKPHALSAVVFDDVSSGTLKNRLDKLQTKGAHVRVQHKIELNQLLKTWLTSFEEQ